jgi:hypothetical protein
MIRRLPLLYLSCGLYYKPMTIVNDDARIINKLGASLIDDARVVNYDCLMFVVQATGQTKRKLGLKLCHLNNW